MAELVREQLLLDQGLGGDEVQIMLEGDVIVPDTKPDMAQLLQTDETIVIDRVEAGSDRLGYVGRLKIALLYVAKDASKSVQAVELTRNIDDFVNMDGATPAMWASARATISNIDYRFVNDRKVNYRAVISIKVAAQSSNNYDAAVHMHDVPENQLLKTSVDFNRTVERKLDRIHVKEQIVLPSNKQSINELLQTTANITNRDIRVTHGRVAISGEIMLTSLYRGIADDSLLEFIESEVPFSGHIDINDATDGMLADTFLQILDQELTVRADDDGEERVIEVDINIGVELRVFSNETITLLEDGYSTAGQLEFARIQVSYPQLVCINRNQAPMRDVVSLPETAPGMLQVFRIKGQPHIDDIQVADDKITIEGAINTSLLYVAESDTTPIASHSTVVPFKQTVEAKGVTAGMSINIDTAIDHAVISMLSPREAEVRFQLTFNTQVAHHMPGSIITGVEMLDHDPATLAAQSSMTVYIVQPGDSLWHIAKHFNTPIDELLEVNELENTRIIPGQKLLVMGRR